MNYNYLVPANSKRQGLIFGIFKVPDLILVSVGIGITFLLFLILNIQKFWVAMIAIAPGLITAFLVFPLPNYHNVRTFIYELYKFYFVLRKKYVWRGWCYKYEWTDEQQSN